ncbi:hypothetical protein HPB49_016686 [Dermacentor silvarum]|uniref:Uncharacterized protein n=1 Tax=Dermacentor silvarum TaxID=543639 RepID=A0ACB8CYK7_DERSI|nr:hypothetical protein HPB49_016686 [Dermacentor silvarum]
MGGNRKKKHSSRSRSHESRSSVPDDTVRTASSRSDATTSTKKARAPRERSSKGSPEKTTVLPTAAKPLQDLRPVEPPAAVADAQAQKATEVPLHALLAAAKLKALIDRKGKPIVPRSTGAAVEQDRSGSMHQERRYTVPSDGQGFAFCCPSDVQALAHYVNASVDPCHSFFDFVCSNIVAHRSRASRPTVSYSSALPPRLNPSFELDVLMAANGTRSEVSTFLRSFFDTCLNTDTNEKSIIIEVSEALVQIAGDHLQNMGPANAFAYLLLTNIKYGIPSVVLVAFRGVDTILFALNQREGCQMSDNKLEPIITSCAAKLNAIFKKAIKLEEVTAYAISVENIYQQDAIMESYTGENATELLQRWHVSTALKEILIGLGEITRVDISGAQEIDALIATLNTPNETNKDAAAAYFLAASTCNVEMDLQWSPTQSSPAKKDFCMHLVDLMPNVRNAMYAVEFITPERSRQVTRVVNSVIKTVKSECTSSSIFQSEDISLLNTFFDSMTLVLPQPLSLSSIEDTHFAQSFVQKLLRGRASEHETRLALAEHGLPFESAATPGRGYNYVALQKGDKIIVSPTLYSFIRMDPTHTDIFNTPVIAHALAESIWSFIIRESELWSHSARAGIDGLVNCFRSRYLTADKTMRSWENEIDTVAASLALSSVVKSFEERDWYKVEAAWPHWSMSHSRFFYMREAFYRCPMSSRPVGKDAVDVPLMYVETFSRAFQCQENDRMAKTRACAFVKT